MRLAAVHTYPVKGCHRLDHDAADVEPAGLAGDRRWMVVDADGVGITQREATALVRLRAVPHVGGLRLTADGRPDLDVAEPTGGADVPVRVFRSRLPVDAVRAGDAADRWLGALLDRPVRLVHLRPLDPGSPDPSDRASFADGYPLLLTTTASLDALNDWLVEAGSEPVPMTRFRPNLVVSGAAPWAEDGWSGRRVRVGDAVFRAAGSCDRCVVTTTDQETGVRGHEPLRTLARHRTVDRKILFGLHLVPDGPGRVAVGDPVTIEE